MLPYDPRLISLPVGVSSFRVGVLDDLDNFPVIVTEKPKKIKTYEGLDAVSLSLKHPDKTANALSLIKKYRDAFKVVPQENFHVEQPAYMIHYLEPVIEDISKPMMDYMKKRILKCSASPTKPQGIRAAELSKDLGVDL